MRMELISWGLCGVTSILLISCTAERVRLAENRPAYSRSEGEQILAPIVREEAPGFAQLKSAADAWLGVPYLWGGNGPDSIDCSGFTQQVFRKAYGIDLPRKAEWQSALGLHVFKYGLRKGDLVFFGLSADSIDHVGIYMGGGMFINATVSSGVKYSSLDETFWLNKYQFARRPILPPVLPELDSSSTTSSVNAQKESSTF